MTKYAVPAYVTVLRTYETVVTREALSPEEALEGAHWEALGLSYELLERLCATEPHTRVLATYTRDVELDDPEEELEDGDEEDDRDG
jgi:hypothetical protein